VEVREVMGGNDTRIVHALRDRGIAPGECSSRAKVRRIDKEGSGSAPIGETPVLAIPVSFAFIDERLDEFDFYLVLLDHKYFVVIEKTTGYWLHGYAQLSAHQALVTATRQLRTHSYQTVKNAVETKPKIRGHDARCPNCLNKYDAERLIRHPALVPGILKMPPVLIHGTAIRKKEFYQLPGWWLVVDGGIQTVRYLPPKEVR